MDFGLTEDQSEIQRNAHDMLAQRASAAKVREHAEARTTDAELWSELRELGWPGIAISEEHGGMGLGAVELSILAEELGATLAPVPFLGSVLAATLIEHAGSDAQRERWLPGLASGELVGAVGRASDGVAGLVVGAPEAQVIVLLDDDGAATVADAADAQIEAIEAIDPTRTAGRVTLPAGAGEALEGDIAAATDRALIVVASELVGVAQAALDMTLEYVKERKQFNTPVGAYQAVSHRCAQMLLDTERARVLTSLASWAADADPERLPEAAAMAKASASAGAKEVTNAAIQMHGGIGFTWEADVHWLFKRAQVSADLLGGAGSHRRRLAAIAAQHVTTAAST
jgi:alkylation response protein AidB-like acyl-CoA dehydrogenase